MSTTNPYVTVTRTGDTFTHTFTGATPQTATYTLSNVFCASHQMIRINGQLEAGLSFFRDALEALAEDTVNSKGDDEYLLRGAAVICDSLKELIVQNNYAYSHSLDIIEKVTAGEV